MLLKGTICVVLEISFVSSVDIELKNITILFLHCFLFVGTLAVCCLLKGIGCCKKNRLNSFLFHLIPAKMYACYSLLFEIAVKNSLDEGR